MRQQILAQFMTRTGVEGTAAARYAEMVYTVAGKTGSAEYELME